MCLTVPLGAAWESLCASQDTPHSLGVFQATPGAIICLLVQPRSLCVPLILLLGPFGAPCTLWLPSVTPAASVLFFCALRNP